MSSISLTGQDGIQIDSRVLADFADGDVASLTVPNDLAAVKSSKNGNLIYAFNETGKQCELSLRVLAGSSDDKYLNSRLQEMKNDFSKFILLVGTFTKRVGDGAGNITNAIYNCTGGIFKRQIEQKTNVEGDTSQSVAVYPILFGNGGRAIQ